MAASLLPPFKPWWIDLWRHLQTFPLVPSRQRWATALGFRLLADEQASRDPPPSVFCKHSQSSEMQKALQVFFWLGATVDPRGNMKLPALIGFVTPLRAGRPWPRLGNSGASSLGRLSFLCRQENCTWEWIHLWHRWLSFSMIW
jgi:hypothetical protein